MFGRRANACRLRCSTRSTSGTTRLSSTGLRRSSGSPAELRRRAGPRRWSLLTPTVLWSVVILAMAPSFYGFGPAPPSGWSGVTASPGAGSYAAGVGRGSGGGVVATVEQISAGESQRRRWNGSPLGAAAWVKQRVRNGKERILMQVCTTKLDRA